MADYCLVGDVLIRDDIDGFLREALQLDLPEAVFERFIAMKLGCSEEQAHKVREHYQCEKISRT